MGELLLTLDTSTPAGSVALSRGETLLAEIFLNLRSTHTDRLLLTVRQLLADTGCALEELDGFGVVLGPGSFTGLRVGVATVKGLALAMAKPVFGVSSLAALAVQVPCAHLPLCALLDARKKEVYAGLFERSGALPVALGGERVLSPERLCDQLRGEVLFVGDGSVAYRSLLVRRLGTGPTSSPGPCSTPGPRPPRCSPWRSCATGRASRWRPWSLATFAPRRQKFRCSAALRRQA